MIKINNLFGRQQNLLKKIAFYLSFIFVIVILLLYKLVVDQPQEISTSKIATVNLKNGDLILRCGRSIESYTVILADSSSKFSHIGIISVENNIPFVIHAVPWKKHTIKKEKINDFINYKVASSYAIYRTNYNSAILKNVVTQANLFYKKKYTFDNEYNLKTNTKLYCTELILKAFKNAGVLLDIQPKVFNYIIGKRPIIYPSEFTKAPIFYKII